jgi:hypothetical protein
MLEPPYFEVTIVLNPGTVSESETGFPDVLKAMIWALASHPHDPHGVFAGLGNVAPVHSHITLAPAVGE